ncbi:MAG: hypothetical protein HY719_08525 [Planctomycetes bacterium]|nr:hypothetical protein [Planctomycetota bacterium]
MSDRVAHTQDQLWTWLERRYVAIRAACPAPDKKAPRLTARAVRDAARDAGIVVPDDFVRFVVVTRNEGLGEGQSDVFPRSVSWYERFFDDQAGGWARDLARREQISPVACERRYGELWASLQPLVPVNDFGDGVLDCLALSEGDRESRPVVRLTTEGGGRFFLLSTDLRRYLLRWVYIEELYLDTARPRWEDLRKAHRRIIGDDRTVPYHYFNYADMLERAGELEDARAVRLEAVDLAEPAFHHPAGRLGCAYVPNFDI